MPAAVSVLVTAFNHESYVRQALDSVAAQTYQDFELIVMDDCSTDGSVTEIRAWMAETGYPTTLLVSAENRGICAARNRELATASGEFVCSLSADDWMEPHRLARQVEALRSEGQDVGAVYGDARVVDAAGRQLSASYLRSLMPHEDPPSGWVFDRLIKRNVIPAMSVLMRRTALDAVGPYDESLAFEDYDMWLRIADRFRIVYQPGVVSAQRVVPTSLGRSSAREVEVQLSRVRLLRKWRGRSATADDAIAAQIVLAAAAISTHDRNLAREVLRQEPHGADVNARVRAAFRRLLMFPGAYRAARGTVRLMRRGRSA